MQHLDDAAKTEKTVVDHEVLERDGTPTFIPHKKSSQKAKKNKIFPKDCSLQSNNKEKQSHLWVTVPCIQAKFALYTDTQHKKQKQLLNKSLPSQHGNSESI